MKTTFTAALTALGLSLGLPTLGLADSSKVVVESAWARASIGTNRPGAAYMTVRNTGSEPVVLIGLETPLAMMPSIHQTKTSESGVSSMSPAGDIVIPPGEAVALEPGGLHAMLMRLQEPMVKGESFSLTLTFADGGSADVDVPILAISARGPEG